MFIANSISGVSQGISMIAIPWYFAMQDKMSTFGLIYIVTNIVGLIWVPYSGTFVDKYNRKYIFMITTIVSGLLLSGIAWYGFESGGLSHWVVGFVFLFTFFNYNIHYPNLYAFVQEITEKERYGSISSYIEIQGQTTNMLAGATAAILLEGSNNGLFNLLGFEFNTGWIFESWDIHEIFALDAVTYFLGFTVIYFIKYTSLTERKTETGPLKERMMVGINYLLKNIKILIFGVGSHSVFAAAIVTTIFLAPIYVKNHLLESGDVFASGKMLFAIGAVFSGIAIRSIFRKLNIPASIILMTLVPMVAYMVLSITAQNTVFFFMFFLMGLCNAGVRIQRVTYLFMHVPNQVYGRAMSIFTQINTLFRILFLSIFSMVFFQEGHNIKFAYAGLSIFLLLSVFVLLQNYKTLEKSK